ncbi:MAG: hypothetical protein MJK04_08295 [Psychrosphaera sp.]|nr:hypothetical protein [Psychrosphaera sp.]
MVKIESTETGVKLMSLAVKDIDTFLIDQVDSGACTCVNEAEEELMALLVKRDINRGIEQGRKDFENGLFEEVNAQTNAKLLDEMAQELGIER